MILGEAHYGGQMVRLFGSMHFRGRMSVGQFR